MPFNLIGGPLLGYGFYGMGSPYYASPFDTSVSGFMSGLSAFPDNFTQYPSFASSYMPSFGGMGLDIGRFSYGAMAALSYAMSIGMQPIGRPAAGYNPYRTAAYNRPPYQYGPEPANSGNARRSSETSGATEEKSVEPRRRSRPEAEGSEEAAGTNKESTTASDDESSKKSSEPGKKSRGSGGGVGSVTTSDLAKLTDDPFNWTTAQKKEIGKIHEFLNSSPEVKYNSHFRYGKSGRVQIYFTPKADANPTSAEKRGLSSVMTRLKTAMRGKNIHLSWSFREAPAERAPETTSSSSRSDGGKEFNAAAVASLANQIRGQAFVTKVAINEGSRTVSITIDKTQDQFIRSFQSHIASEVGKLKASGVEKVTATFSDGSTANLPVSEQRADVQLEPDNVSDVQNTSDTEDVGPPPPQD